tara:strand:+ start:21095 stop:21952 length:858 start_codon:yes stop_codon:yes gene_type:complete
MKILVTGSSGQLGQEINKISANYNYDWYFTSSNNFDISKLNKINSNLSEINPDIIINCSAYTSVEKAEKDYRLANILNNKSVDIISKWTYNNNCKLIHISTNFVFNGKSKIPLKEDCETGPINIYGKTKLDGDLVCVANNPNSIILRTSWLYSSYGNNFVKNIISKIRNNKEINVVNDEYGSPTYAANLANVIMQIISYKFWHPGIYNFTDDGDLSWYDFACEIRDLIGINYLINSISTKDYPSNVKRPSYSVLDKSKIIKTFHIHPQPFKDALKACIKILTNEE